jgi:E3 ubiquitin-protein ligase SIAH1
MEAGEASPTSELLAPPPLPERVKRSGKRARDGPLLFGTQLIKHEGKDDELVEAAPQGAEAIVPSKSPERRPPTAVQVDKTKLYCSLCACALTPPIYQVGFI